MLKAPREWLRTAATLATDLMFPPQCAACSCDLEGAGETLLCVACREALLGDFKVACPRCAAPLPEHLHLAANCPHCRTDKFAFAGAVALGSYEGQLHDAILRMKQPLAEPLTATFGNILADRLLRAAAPRADLAVPIPIHWWRRVMRGANGIELLAETVARRLRIPCYSDLLIQRRLRPQQHKLSSAERRLNLRGAFRASRRFDIKGACVLVVDDVLTTGTTAHTAAQALKKAGAAEVRVAVVARGIGV